MYKDRFLNYLQNEKRYSSLTVSAYNKDLEQFFSFLSCQYHICDLKEVNHLLIRSWVVHLINDSIAARSVNRKISTLKSYYRFALREKIVEVNPMVKIRSPKMAKKLPVFVEQSNMNELFDNIKFENTNRRARDRLIIMHLYATGIRLSELINIKVSDVDLYQCLIKVYGKGKKERILPFTLELKKELDTYLKLANPVHWLFLTDKEKKMYPKLVYRIVNNYLSRVTTVSKRSPHVLRHTFATHMLNNGAELNAIKEFLGHASLAATQVYTHNSIKKLTKIYKQAHPRA